MDWFSMLEIIRYDYADKAETIAESNSMPMFESLDEAKDYTEPNWKPYKITIKIEEIPQ